jgi:CBS-domain-containing membrane protein
LLGALIRVVAYVSVLRRLNMVAAAIGPLDRLDRLRVDNVMTRNVVVIPATSTMDEAGDLLESANSTGAPVIDCDGRCIGMLSATDFLRFETCRGGDEDYSHVWRDALNGESLPWNSLQRFMSPIVHAVNDSAPLLLAADRMCVEGVHRLIVLDNDGTPTGSISTLDVVSALVESINEHRQRDI